MARFRRRRYDPYDDAYGGYGPYDPYDPYDPRNRRWGRPRRYYGPAPGGSCLRDACLLETGCCIAESLDGNCLVLTLLAGPQLFAVLLRAPGADRVDGPAVADGPAVDGRPAVTDDPAVEGRVEADRPAVADGPTAADRIVGAIRVYQRRVSVRRPPVCRFTPSCSEYAAQAVTAHGAARGGLLALRRLLRCRPGGRRGPDPVPPA